MKRTIIAALAVLITGCEYEMKIGDRVEFTQRDFAMAPLRMTLQQYDRGTVVDGYPQEGRLWVRFDGYDFAVSMSPIEVRKIVPKEQAPKLDMCRVVVTCEDSIMGEPRFIGTYDECVAYASRRKAPRLCQFDILYPSGRCASWVSKRVA